MQRWELPEEYQVRANPQYHDDTRFRDSDIVHEPEVYEAVRFLLARTGRSRVLDLGCGSGRKLLQLPAGKLVGVDYGANIAFCRGRNPQDAEWIEADFQSTEALRLVKFGGPSTIVVCADAIQHLTDPTILLALLEELYLRGCIVVTSTPDRIRNHGAAHAGPPPNLSHVREWTLAEYTQMLEAAGLGVTYAGLTINNSVSRQPKTLITISDPDLHRAVVARSAVRPLAIISTFNEADMIGEVVADWLRQGCDVHLIDNWSEDETWRIARSWASRAPSRVSIERFPDQPADECSWQKILHRKERIAAQFRGRWIVHTDADELRRTPFTWLNFADSLDLVAATGGNRLDFNLVNFRPVSSRSPGRGQIEASMRSFEYGSQPGHWIQAKAWLQGPELVQLAGTGGHSAVFPGARSFRYKFLLKHYPYRSPEHAQRKVFRERKERFSPLEKTQLGWYSHYDAHAPSDTFIWAVDKLNVWQNDEEFWRDHGLFIMTDLMERRGKANPPQVPDASRKLV